MFAPPYFISFIPQKGGNDARLMQIARNRNLVLKKDVKKKPRFTDTPLRMTLTVFSYFCSSVRVRIISSAKRLAKTMLTAAHADLHRSVHYFIFGRLYGCHHLFKTFLRLLRSFSMSSYGVQLTKIPFQSGTNISLTWEYPSQYSNVNSAPSYGPRTN